MRDMNIGFYGAGCPHVGVECFIAQVNKLLMHYGCASNNGLKLKVSLEYLIVELGISAQPLQESYERYSERITHSWLKSLWEKCHKFDVLVEFANVPLELPREGDQWLMLLLAAAGFNQDELLRLNRVQIHQQVLFLSCILGASGKTLDARYLKRRPPTGEHWSRLRFPKENSPAKDFQLWERALKQMVQAGGITD